MQRRSTARNAPRKRYTVDAFEGIPELEGVAEEDDEPAAGDDSGDSEDEAGPNDDSEDDEILSVDDEAADDPAANDAVDDPLDDLVEDSEHEVSRAQRRRVSKLTELKEVPGISEAKRKWAHDRTLPTRKEGLRQVGGFHPTYSQSDEARDEETRSGWSWYHEQRGKDAFLSRQTLEPLNVEDAVQYLGPQEPRSFVMGPYDDQKLFTLSAGESVALPEAWPESSPSAGADTHAAPLHRKPGFILNLGAKTRCLRWIPGRESQGQYLTTVSSSEGASADENDTGSEESHKGGICIWRIDADAGCSIDTTPRPLLKAVICTDWGTIKAIEWCHTRTDNTETLGLLAIIAEDGKLRILDVPLPDERTMVRLQVKQAAFEFKPTSTTCSCVAWLSPTRLAFGCADGSAVIWDISEPASAETSSPSTRSIRMSNRHVHAIASCVPSHPDMLLTSSVDGTLKVADLDEPTPQALVVNALRPLNVITQPLLVWHEYAQRLLATDDNCEVLARPLRKRKRLQQPLVARAKSAITAIATSPCHPCILVGTAGGEVIATNPLLNATNDPRADVWQQTWLAHEWRRPTAAETAVVPEDTTELEVEEQGEDTSIGKHGLSRFLEGLKPEHVKTKGKESASTAKGAYTIYEEQTAITAVAWNPNLRYGGWAAAATADGLVRVEDIAI